MNRSINNQQKRVIIKATIVSCLLAVAVNLAWSGLLYLEYRSGHQIPTWLSLVESMACLYVLYRFAFHALRPGFFKSAYHAGVTALLVGLQNLIQLIVTAIPWQPANAHFGLIFDTPTFLVVQVIAVIISFAIIAIVTYFFAYRRSQKSIKRFRLAIPSKTPRIGGKTRTTLLGYAILITLGGGLTIAIELSKVVTQHYYFQLLDVASWLTFITIIWLALRSKAVGRVWFWQLSVPLIIALDVVNIVGQSHGGDIIFSLILSMPEYVVAIWYAYHFMVAMARRSINKLNPEELFV